MQRNNFQQLYNYTMQIVSNDFNIMKVQNIQMYITRNGHHLLECEFCDSSSPLPPSSSGLTRPQMEPPFGKQKFDLKIFLVKLLYR